MPLVSVDSTNNEALRQAAGGDVGQLWITAQQQTQGKARRGRDWVSRRGNLYASLLLIDPAPVEALTALPLVVSLALHNAIVAAIPGTADQLRIKWPNDILLSGRKLSGILLETAPDPHGRSAVVIGCGINCSDFPENPLYPATSLAAQGFSIEPESLFPYLARAMAQGLKQWNEGRGFAHIRSDWLDRAANLGGQIVARFPDHQIAGRFVDLDAQGFLLLETPDGKVRPISAADIFFEKQDESGA